MSQTLEALVVELRADIKGLQASLQTATSSVSKFSKSAENDVNSVNNAVLSLRRQVLSMAAVWATFKVGKGIADAGVQVQALRNKMLAATGDSTVAAEAMAYVRSEAERLGLQIQSTADGFAGFAASSLRAGLTFKQTKDIFTGVSEAATSMQLPAEQVALVFKALEQIAGKGTVAMEELRGQLGDALPGAFEIAAKAMGKSTAEFTKMVSQGEVAAYDFLPKFAEQIRKELGGSVNEAANSAQAAFNRLNNSFFDLKTQLAESGFLDDVTGAVKDLTAALNDPQMVEGLKGFAQLLGDIVSAAGKAAAAIGEFYSSAQDTKEALANWNGKGNLFDYLEEAKKTSDLRKRVLSEFIANQQNTTGAGASDGYTKGAPSGNQTSQAQLNAQKKAQQLRDQLRGQVDSLAYGFASPEQQATLDVENQQKLLKEALDKKAITEQEYRDLSLQAELEYQDKLKEIREKARDDEQSALESFLGIRLKSQEEMNSATIQEQAQSFRTTISEAAKHNKAFFELEKAASIARALIAARESVVSAYNFGARLGGPVLGAAFAGVAAAAQAANIAAIASTSYSGGSSSGVSASGNTSGSSSDTSSSSSNSTTASKSVYITLNGDDAFYSKNQIRKLIENINDAIGDGSQLKVAVS